MTSAITAPLATAYAICGCLGWSTETRANGFRSIAIATVLLGALAAIFLDGSPVATILTAQIANGLLLPVVAVIMLLVVRRHTIKRTGKTSAFAMVAAWCVVVLISALGLWRATTGIQQLF